MNIEVAVTSTKDANEEIPNVNFDWNANKYIILASDCMAQVQLKWYFLVYDP